MLKIDQLVDAICGYPRMTFLDAFQGYHQIALAIEGQEKTSFISLKANYHYTNAFCSKECEGYLSKSDD